MNEGLYQTLVTIPVLMALIASALILLGGGVAVTAALPGSAEGLFATSAPVGWRTHLTPELRRRLNLPATVN